MKPLVVPVINLNGNTATSLVEQLQAVLHDIRALENSMSDAWDIVHPRNFQTVRDGDKHVQARAAWAERRTMVSDLLAEVTKLALAIQEQGNRSKILPQADTMGG